MGKNRNRYGQSILVIIMLTAALSTAYESSVTMRNVVALSVVHAILDPNLGYLDRQGAFTKAAAQSDTSPWLSAIAETERRDLEVSKKFLESYEVYKHLEPGRQLMVNPVFSHDLDGWIEYFSDWHVTDISTLTYSGPAVVFDREGGGHSALSQVHRLVPGLCYLFSVTGMTRRQSGPPTLWLYWETYDERGRPQGHVLQKGHDNEPWQHFLGVFCLPSSGQVAQTINIAPLNIYGDVTAYVGSARLYELRPTDIKTMAGPGVVIDD